MPDDGRDGYTKGEVDILKALERLETEVRNLKEMAQTYVSRVEFEARIEPLQRVVYGLVGVVLIAVAGGLVAMVLK